MKIKATWEFDADVDGLDSKFIDIQALVKDLAMRELNYLLVHNELNADDFDYIICCK